MRIRDKKRSIRISFIITALIVLTGCGFNNVAEPVQDREMKTGFIPERPGMYDSADTAVIIKIDKTKEEIVFFNTIVKKKYTLHYDGVSKTMDKYGETISIDQFEAGEIADIHFLKEKKKLASIQKSEIAFTLDEVQHHMIDEKKKEITIGKDVYQFDDNLLIFSRGKKMELIDINEADQLTITGIDRKIYSIRVEKGHGYLRLKNEENMIDGWIEVGNSIIQKIREEMLLVVPEGTYEVLLTKGAVSEKKRITIRRDKETELDLADICKEEEKEFGNLIFAVTPETAEVYIDGETVDLSVPYQVEYGIHQMIVRADGYQTLKQYIKVGQPNATIQVSLHEGEKNSVSSNNIQSPDSQEAASATGGKLTISAPEGVELYMDGNYIGMTPASVKKTKGVHVIVLRKSGYSTRSYTVNIENTDTDQTMSFSELEREENPVVSTEDSSEGEDKKEESSESGEKTVKTASQNN